MRAHRTHRRGEASAPVRALDFSLTGVRLIATVLVTTYVLSLLANALGARGFLATLAVGGKALFLVGLVALLVARAVLTSQDRRAWLCLAAGGVAYTVGTAGYEIVGHGGPVLVRPDWFDAGFMAFYPLVCAALFLMLRARLRQLTSGMWLDSVVTGLTAASVATALALGESLQESGGTTLVVVYPIADLLLLVLLAGALAGIGPGAGAVWWLLTAGTALFVLTDTVYAYQVAQGTYQVGGVLDIGWGVAFLCFGL